MYTALYREYRPEVFEEMLGQEHIVKILKNQIDADSVSHAYLFCGTRGTGKTTTARILAKGLNCLSEGSKPCGTCSACESIKDGTFLDVIEIDAASNNGVDNIRELRESVKYPPAAGRKKVYIIDEVHMLSSGAFNALLKTLEEPPEYVVFILATTEPQKLPSTILSRCMRLDFKRVPEVALIKGMSDICGRKGVDVSEDALRIIAANSDGSVRDGLSILDQCISGADGRIEAKDVLEFLGASGEETFVELTDLVTKGRTADAMVLLAKALADGKDVRQFMRDWINHYRNLLMTKFIKNPQDVIGMSVENIDRIRRQSETIELAHINRGILELSRTMNEARWSTQPRILLELAVVKLSDHIQRTTPLKEPKAGKLQESAAKAPETEAKAAPKQDSRKEQPAEAKEEIPEKQEQPEAESGREEDAEPESRQEYDLGRIWNAVFEDGEAAKGSFYIIGRGASLREIGEYDFTVAVSSDHIKTHTEKNRELLEDLMEKHTGKRRTLKLVLDSGDKDETKKSVEEIAREAGDILGIDVEIQ
ncbi:MAG: DNA polymerase III subunit gamma/tau [Bacillota bacterium]|nr:DNA polymerase III subunit gamma/tau [Bacillota bacterium]